MASQGSVSHPSVSNTGTGEDCADDTGADNLDGSVHVWDVSQDDLLPLGQQTDELIIRTPPPPQRRIDEVVRVERTPNGPLTGSEFAAAWALPISAHHKTARRKRFRKQLPPGHT